MKRFVLAAALVACAHRDSPTLAEDPALPAVATPSVRRELTAIVVPQATRIVTAQIEGHIRMFIGPGDAVRAGDVIADLDDAALHAELTQVHADEIAWGGELQAASTELARNRHDLALNQYLAQRGGLARETVRTSADAMATTQGRLRAASDRYEAAKARRLELQGLDGIASVAAPIGGVITMVKTKDGELVNKGAPIVQISDPERVWLRFAVPRDVELRSGARVEASLDGRARPVLATIRKWTDTSVDAELDEPIALGSTGKAWLVDAP